MNYTEYIAFEEYYLCIFASDFLAEKEGLAKY